MTTEITPCRRSPLRRLAAVAPALGLAALAVAAPALAAGRLEHHTVHGVALENTLTGESPDRTVAVYLPPDYDTEPERRYPVVYLLHGIGDTEGEWTEVWEGIDPEWGTVARLMDHGIAAGRLAPMIVVMPDERTKAGGSFYLDSSVSGGWETFTVRELVAWTDSSFRTIQRPASRGVAGHSMGGYGAIVLGMKHPDVYSAVYALSPSTLAWGGDLGAGNPAFRTVLDRRGWEQLEGFYEKGIVCLGQAFSPNPDKPPFFVDFPSRVDEAGKLVPAQPGFAGWEAHFPVNHVETMRDNLLHLAGLRFDAGTEDQFSHIPLGARELSARLTEQGVPHLFELYNGDHRNRLWGRTGRLYTEVLPWFSLLLEHQERPAAAAAELSGSGPAAAAAHRAQRAAGAP